MNCRSARAVLLLTPALAGAAFFACGKRADPLAPYVKTPQVPTGLEIAQIGNEIEIRVTAPRTTTEARPLPVIELEWLQGPAIGDWNKAATSLVKEPVAPGESRAKRFPRPDQELRYSVRAQSGKARSAPAVPVTFKPATVPLPPTALQAISVTTGVEVRWINPPGAEPWPTPAPAPSPTPSPLPLPAQGVAPDPEPSPPKAPSSPAAPPPSASAILLPPTRVSPPPAASAPSPTPLPTPPTGIRIFRTDGIPRLAGPPLQASTWLDPSPRVGETACYALRYATSFKPVVESAPTDPVCVEMKDVAPPEPPDKLLGDLGDGFVELSWAASPSSDVAAYRIYKTTDSRPRALLLETQGPVLRVRDSSTGSGVRTYEAVALDKSGNESKPTPAIKVIVP